MPKYTDADIAKAVEMIDYFGHREFHGERRAWPLPLYEAIYRANTKPAVEPVIMNSDETHYALQRRPAHDHVFGPRKLNLPGGTTKIGEFPDPVNEARWMAVNECGFEDIEYAAVPIATYQWLSHEHPRGGFPFSLVYVFRTLGGSRSKDIVWYPMPRLPQLRSMVNGRAGKIQHRFVGVFRDWWLSNGNQPCVDLNVNW